MKKVLVISSVLLGVFFLAGCGQKPVSQTQSTTPAPVTQTPSQPVVTPPADETANWKTYSSMGVTIKYPNDGSYSIETPETDRFIITQEHPGNRILIGKTTDSPALSDNEKAKIINGNSYKVFYREGMGNGYGYVIKHNGQFYTFESVQGPENEVFELIMTTVKFE